MCIIPSTDLGVGCGLHACKYSYLRTQPCVPFSKAIVIQWALLKLESGFCGLEHCGSQDGAAEGLLEATSGLVLQLLVMPGGVLRYEEPA